MKKFLTFGMVVVLLFLTIVPAFADAASYPIEPADFYVYVATPDGGLNMRSGPGVEYPRVIDHTIPDGVRLHITATSDNWGHTEYNGEYGWVALKQTSEKPPVVSEVEQVVTEVVTERVTIVQQVTEIVTEVVEITTEKTEETQQDVEEVNVENEGNNISFIGSFLLVGIVIVLIILVAILLIVVINSKAKKK